ncbi:MAG: hypothetical protein R2708_24540 [Vicinamibacterales bacterium]
MSTIRVSTVVAAIAALALSAIPAPAQDARRGNGDQQSQSRAERRRPRSDNGGQRNGGRRAQADRGRRDSSSEAGPRSNSADRGPRSNGAQVDRGPRTDSPQVAPRRQAVPRADRGPRPDYRGQRYDNNNGNRNRAGRVVPRRDGRDGWRYDNRGNRTYRYLPPVRGGRGYSRPSRVVVVPYGYRPRGYRPGWSFNLYFGRPYGARYPGYYGSGGYGYYALPSGFAYGSLRIVDAPRHAPVYVDGYYAGEVDDYDGVFQRLNLEPGEHRIEIDLSRRAAHGVRGREPGRTVTIHARP